MNKQLRHMLPPSVWLDHMDKLNDIRMERNVIRKQKRDWCEDYNLDLDKKNEWPAKMQVLFRLTFG